MAKKQIEITAVPMLNVGTAVRVFNNSDRFVRFKEMIVVSEHTCRAFPRLQILSRAQIEEIHRATLHVLERVGVRVYESENNLYSDR